MKLTFTAAVLCTACLMACSSSNSADEETIPTTCSMVATDSSYTLTLDNANEKQVFNLSDKETVAAVSTENKTDGKTTVDVSPQKTFKQYIEDGLINQCSDVSLKAEYIDCKTKISTDSISTTLVSAGVTSNTVSYYSKDDGRYVSVTDGKKTSVISSKSEAREMLDHDKLRCIYLGF